MNDDDDKNLEKLFLHLIIHTFFKKTLSKYFSKFSTLFNISKNQFYIANKYFNQCITILTNEHDHFAFKHV